CSSCLLFHLFGGFFFVCLGGGFILIKIFYSNQISFKLVSKSLFYFLVGINRIFFIIYMNIGEA
ncbi:hypothetical protein ACJX0J_014183, partial [Zea mays]